MTANSDIYDKAVDRSAMVRLYERRIQGKVEDVINEHQGRTSGIVLSTKPHYLTSQGFLKELDYEIKNTYSIAHGTTSRSLIDLVGDQVSFTYQNLEAGVGRVFRVYRPEKRLAEDIVLDRPLYKNIKLEQGWYNVSENERKRIELLIRKGLSEGLTPSEIALQVRRGNVFNISRSQAFGLVRTATTAVQAEADWEVYKANSKALRGFQFVAVLDSRTSQVCASADGRVYDLDKDKHMLPPLHWNCRSTTIPIVKSYADLSKLEGVAQIRRDNLLGLTPGQVAYYDGVGPMKESYDTWLRRQPYDVQLKHIGDLDRLKIFQSGQLHLDKFSNNDGKSLGIRELRLMTDGGEDTPGTTRRFAQAKEQLDALNLGVNRPDDLYNNKDLVKNLKTYYELQQGDLDGLLSLVPYRGTTLGTKRATKTRVLNNPPTEDNLIYNPVTGRYEDARIYAPSQDVLNNNLRLMEESTSLLPRDKEFIRKFIEGQTKMGFNQKAVIVDNLRIVIGRARENKEPWTNFKAVLNAQMKFDVMNTSDFIETNLRRNQNLIKRLSQDNYFDPVLGEVQLQEIHDSFINNIKERNRWEDVEANKVASKLRPFIDIDIPVKLKRRLGEKGTEDFYKRYAARLAVSENPDRDQLAMSLGRDLYNSANYRGTRQEWYKLGLKLIDRAIDQDMIKLDSYGVQKRRLRSKLSGNYFGPYYDTISYYVVVLDPRIQRYSKLNRLIDVGLRLGVTIDKNRLEIVKGKKTYQYRNFFGLLSDSRIPITSTDSFHDFPEEFIGKDIEQALNWTANAQYRIDEEFHDFAEKLLFFRDDKGRAEYYDSLNEFKDHIVKRGDSYERFKAMKWLRNKGASFSNHPYMDSRGRLYERGFIGPQAGETFRPFLSTAEPKDFSVEGFYNLQDIIGATLGGASDFLEGRFNSLTQIGRQQIAEKWRPDLIEIGNHIRRGKPQDIRDVLDHPFMHRIDGEEQGKVMRLALEMARIDEYLRQNAGKIYQQKGGGRIDVGDGEYIDLNRALIKAANKPTTYVDIDTIYFDPSEKIFDTEDAFTKKSLGDERRITKADLDTPLLLEEFKDTFSRKLLWIDGWHRLVKAKRLGIKKLPAKIISHDEVLDSIVTSRKDLLNDDRVDPYSDFGLESLKDYKISVALEQDASSSGAQIIALTTKNRELAALSNVIPTDGKKRLYDEIAAATFQDPRFKELNKRLGLTEKDLRKAAKAQNMVTFYGAGERTGILNVEKKLAKALGRNESTLVVTTGERDKVLSEISARAARYKDFNPELHEELMALRQDVKDIFNKGEDPGYDILRQLYFLDNDTRAVVEKMTMTYDTVVTPSDFSTIAKIMSENLRQQVPILKDFTKYFGRLAREYAEETKQVNIPWKTFDGKTIEQYFPLSFEERLVYKTKEGEWVTNFIQNSQKTDPTFFDELLDRDGKIRDVVDAQKAVTAYAVNGNHSNDAVIVRKFHLWGRKNGIETSTIHDAFFTNASDLLAAKQAIRESYADAVDTNPIKATLDEMRSRGLPYFTYRRYLEEAIELGLIPVVGKSRVGGRLLTDQDILTREMILEDVPARFWNSNKGWYGIGP
jgi:SPP1 gp7 family putative phage head morphogenesis protein